LSKADIKIHFPFQTVRGSSDSFADRCKLGQTKAGRSDWPGAVATVKYILTMATTVKLQKIGNSIRATIPREVAESLDLKPGEEMVIDATDGTVLLKKKRSVSDLYGVLKKNRRRVKHWPTPDEIKNIWG